MKKLCLRIGITFASLLVALILFEFYLRREVTYVVQNSVKDAGEFLEANPEFLVTTSTRGRRLVPNANVTIKNHFLSNRDIPIVTNSIGFRGKEIPPPDKNQLRIMFLGDSITIEDYLPEEETWVQKVENRLRREFAPRQIVAINAGVGNIGTEEELNILEDTIEQVRPDIIVLGFYLNDSRPPWGFSGEIGDRGWLRRHSLIAETIYRQMEQRRWVETQGVDRFAWIPATKTLDWRSKPEGIGDLAKLAKYDWGAAWQEESWIKIDEQFSRLNNLAKRYQAKALVVAFPVIYQVESTQVDDFPQRRLKSLSNKWGFEYLDLLPALRNNSGKELYFDHCHPNKLGSALIGEIIADKLGAIQEDVK